MRRLMQAFEENFDLAFRVDDETLGTRLSAMLEGIEERPLPDWGTKGVAHEMSAAGTPTLRFYYVPHLFPGMDETLRLAHKLQFHLLPRTLPEGAPVTLAAVLESYCHLSGDLLGWESLDDGEFLIWILDMAGHGVRAGLASAVLKTLIDHKRSSARVDEIATYLNRSLLACTADRRGATYATGFFLSLKSDGSASYLSAGHPPIYLRRNDGSFVALESNARPLGLLADSVYERKVVPLESGDRFLLYTDGLSEIFSERAEARGGDDLAAAFRARDEPPAPLVASIFEELSSFKTLAELDDDVTFLAGERL